MAEFIKVDALGGACRCLSSSKKGHFPFQGAGQVEVLLVDNEIALTEPDQDGTEGLSV